MDWVSILTNSLTAGVGLEAVAFALAAMGLNLHFGYTGIWNPTWVVLPENYTASDWVCVSFLAYDAPSNIMASYHLGERSVEC